MRFLGVHNPLHVQDYGEDYHPEDTSGIITVNPPKVSPARYGNLVPQVDPDGNEFELMVLLPRAQWGDYEHAAPVMRLNWEKELKK